MQITKRCTWCGSDELYRHYHDTEWGKPLLDDRLLFEKLCLEAAQAGLSWITVLRKRENYRLAFDGFDPQKIVKYDEIKIQELMNNSGIIRNRRKIDAMIHNAGIYLKILEETGSFKDYIWSFVNHQPIINHWKVMNEIPATSPVSDAMSKALKKKGFKFVGSTICYAFMQSVGMVNDHLVDCDCYSMYR
ncbi:MAG TPA: DNA-3-methyladenine glycosylase I [Candidatus Cloacimonadota bacterium]|jgi:DNA-3-methyladenine glycosylase I|nr:DNA-3-methyladenine glycosylase I [Candidatus Cloacimonadota bacterium]HOD53808.1 DNA-3-methyladenine glycosylase I [Candidatus Cloacimonadota bacterium]